MLGNLQDALLHKFERVLPESSRFVHLGFLLILIKDVTIREPEMRLLARHQPGFLQSPSKKHPMAHL